MSDPVDVAKVGNLTEDPELRHSQSGTAYATFGLAYRPYVPKGQPEPETTFYEVVAFAGLAEHVATSLRKGDRALVIGKGEMEHWTGKDGVQRSKRKIVADGIGPDLRFLDVDLQRTARSEAGPKRPVPDDEEPF